MCASKVEVKNIIRQCYKELWNNWYRNHPDIETAKLKITIDEKLTDDGYSHSKKCIFISLGTGNLEDCSILNTNFTSAWYGHLIHEMIHEYQRKTIKIPTKEGSDLFEKYRCIAERWGHGGKDALYFTAIISVSSFLGLTPKQLINEI